MSGNQTDLLARADEYVLGLLDPAEALAFEAEAERDPAIRSAIAASRDRFVELDLAMRPAADAGSLWERIEGGLTAAPDTGPAPTNPAIRKPAANDNRWRAAALAGMAASTVLAVMLGWNVLLAPEPQVIAILVNDAGEPLVMVEDFGNASARVTPLTEFDVPKGRTMQVWTLPSAELGPVSLGLLASSRTAVLDGPELPEPRDAQLYEITLEQEGGSPTGRPTGPILVKGYAKIPR